MDLFFWKFYSLGLAYPWPNLGLKPESVLRHPNHLLGGAIWWGMSWILGCRPGLQTVMSLFWSILSCQWHVPLTHNKGDKFWTHLQYGIGLNVVKCLMLQRTASWLRQNSWEVQFWIGKELVPRSVTSSARNYRRVQLQTTTLEQKNAGYTPTQIALHIFQRRTIVVTISKKALFVLDKMQNSLLQNSFPQVRKIRHDTI